MKYLLTITLLFIQSENSFASDLVKEALRFVGRYQVTSCTEGHVYGPLEIAVKSLPGNSIEFEIQDRVFPKELVNVDQFGTKTSSNKIKNDWGCYREKKAVSFAPGKLQIQFKQRFYNLCLTPEIGSSVTENTTYLLSAEKLNIRSIAHDKSGKTVTECTLTKE